MILEKIFGNETWDKMIRDHERERIKYLELSARFARKHGLSRREAAIKMKISYGVLSKLIQRYQIDWPVNGKPTGPKRIPLSEYKRCASIGMNQAETALELGVSGPAVSAISRKYNIKFDRKGLRK